MEFMRMKWICIFLSGILSVRAIDVEVNHAIQIECTLQHVEFPEWTGPENLAKPLTSGQTINEPGFEWVDNLHLNITSAQTKFTGQYICVSGTMEGNAKPINVLTYDVTMAFLNMDTEDVTGTERLIGESDKDMSVVCQVTGGNPAPTVSFSFADTVTNPPDVSSPTITNAMTVDNTYTVNASVIFVASDSVDYEYLTCSASYTGRPAVNKQILLYFLHPPMQTSSEITQFPTWQNRDMKAGCHASSRPETTFNWIIDGKNISDSELDVSEDSLTCVQNSSTHIYDCGSNITIKNIKKEDNGKEFTCEYVFQGNVKSTAIATRISLPFPSTQTTLSGNTTGVVDDTGFATITLTCSSNSANPVSKLRWFIGSKLPEINNVELNSTYDATVMDVMYDGKNVTQDIDVQANRSMNGETVTCCVFPLSDSICDTIKLDVKYPPLILAPQLSEYRAYAGDDISIPCIAGSNPASHIAWYRVDGQTTTLISNNTSNPTNVFYLQIVNITMTDAADYKCKAWLALQGVNSSISKSTTLIVVDKPSQPNLFTTVDGENYYIEFQTSDTAPDVPRRFYIQYKTGNALWQERADGIDDTLPGQEPQLHSYIFRKTDLLTNNTEYEFRIKSVDLYGLVAYTDVYTLRTDKPIMNVDAEETVTMTQYTNAILISVFVTAAVFLILIIVIVCVARSGKCASSSSKSYVM